MRKLLPLILLLLIGCQASLTGDGQTIGMVAPDFKVRRVGIDNSSVRLSDLKGKVVLLDFWATWCGPCRMAMPEVDKLYKEYKEKGLEVMAISDEEPDVIAKFEKDADTTYPVYVDLFHESAAPYGVDSYPTFILIGRNGRIAGDLRGYGPGMVESMVKQALQ